MSSMFSYCQKFNNGSIDSNGDSSSEAQNALVWNTSGVTTDEGFNFGFEKFCDFKN